EVVGDTVDREGAEVARDVAGEHCAHENDQHAGDDVQDGLDDRQDLGEREEERAAMRRRCVLLRVLARIGLGILPGIRLIRRRILGWWTTSRRCARRWGWRSSRWGWRHCGHVGSSSDGDA